MYDPNPKDKYNFKSDPNLYPNAKNENYPNLVFNAIIITILMPLPIPIPS